MEECMIERTTSDATSSATVDDKAIRERVKGLTSQVLQQGRIDPDAVRDVARAVIGGTPSDTATSGPGARELLADAIRELDEALVKSANLAHEALQQLAARGNDFTDNDLKEALVRLRKLESDYTAAAKRITEAMSGNLRREMSELAARAQNIGVEASARVASMLDQIAGGVGATSGMATVRDASARMALLFSGVLAGVADALRDQREEKSGK
jgi:Family of unknown function (DUF6781)